jgi:molybdate-binding protein
VVAGESWAIADGILSQDELVLLPGADGAGLVVAGCDPALGLAAGLVNRRSPQRLLPVHASTTAAVDALRRGRVHGVVIHGPDQGLPDPVPGVVRWEVASWRVGLAGPAGRPVPSLDEVCGRRMRVVQREPGAGSQSAFERAVLGAGGKTPPGPVGAGHVDVARRVAAGAKAGVTMEAAAGALGLGFEPLEVHRVELWIDERWLEEPAAVALCELLSSSAFLRRLELVGGYDLSRCGTKVGAA